MNGAFQNPERIAVLLSTYNGEKFLGEQLDSLFRQTEQNFHLYVRDDGSTDGTLRILNDFRKAHPERISFVETPTERLSAYRSFMALLEAVDSDYYFFCDQDDVWFPEKIQLFMKRFEKEEKLHPRGTPILVFSDVRVVSENFEKRSDSFFAKLHFSAYKKNPKILYTHNVVSGLSMAINREAKKLAMPASPLASMHDEWISLSVFSRGGILSAIEKPTAYYRQHEKNAVGAGQNHSAFRLLCPSWIKKIFAKARLAHKEFHLPYFKFLWYKILYQILK